VNDAVADAAALLRRLLGERVTLDVTLEQPGRAVRIDPSQLDQVLINLAVNARDAMPRGGRLTLATGHATIYAPRATPTATIPPGRYVTIAVADTGTGIPPDILPRIFEPFFTTRRTQGGSGLGLSTVLGIVHQSGGFLEVDSTPGQGTGITLYLPRHRVEDPVAPPPAPVLSPPPARPPVAGAGRIALVAEDEALVRRTLTQALTRAGWQVMAAESGEAALEMVRTPKILPESQPSVVIADVVMPGMDGVALVRAMRQLWPGLPAVLVSGYADHASRQALAEDDIAYLSKPYETAELLATVARLAGPPAQGTAEPISA
jgi:two-component system cell cycle sensor histidine kinase/response regulator CckA